MTPVQNVRVYHHNFSNVIGVERFPSRVSKVCTVGETARKYKNISVNTGKQICRKHLENFFFSFG